PAGLSASSPGISNRGIGWLPVSGGVGCSLGVDACTCTGIAFTLMIQGGAGGVAGSCGGTGGAGGQGGTGSFAVYLWGGSPSLVNLSLVTGSGGRGGDGGMGGYGGHPGIAGTNNNGMAGQNGGRGGTGGTR